MWRGIDPELDRRLEREDEELWRERERDRRVDYTPAPRPLTLADAAEMARNGRFVGALAVAGPETAEESQRRHVTAVLSVLKGALGDGYPDGFLRELAEECFAAADVGF